MGNDAVVNEEKMHVEPNDESDIEHLFAFKYGIPAIIKTLDGKMFITSIFAADPNGSGAGVFLRPENEPTRLVLIPWGNISTIESEVLIEDE